jgi:hypothetical protein
MVEKLAFGFKAYISNYATLALPRDRLVRLTWIASREHTRIFAIARLSHKCLESILRGVGLLHNYDENNCGSHCEAGVTRAGWSTRDISLYSSFLVLLVLSRVGVQDYISLIGYIVAQLR